VIFGFAAQRSMMSASLAKRRFHGQLSLITRLAPLVTLSGGKEAMVG
jgi:hypothetical protein